MNVLAWLLVVAMSVPLFTRPTTKQIQWASATQGEAFAYGPFPMCMSGGWGCIAGETRIDDTLTGRTFTVAEMTAAGYAPTVLAWTGARFVPVRASVPFVKGIAPLYRVTTDSGRSIIVTDRHRFLTPQAWGSLANARVHLGAQLLGVAVGAPPSTADGVEASPSTYRQDGRRSRHTSEGFQVGCSVGPQAHHHRGDGRLLLAEGADREQLPSRVDAQRCTLDGQLEDDQVARPARNRSDRRIVHPSNLDRAASWDTVSSIKYVGEEQFYDLHVPLWNNYLAEGVVNHNSGKTHCGILKALWLSTTFAKNRGVIARRVSKELRATTMATAYKVIPPRLYDRRTGGRRNDIDGYLRFSDSQSEILFLHLDDPETEGIIRGLEINWFLIDQAEEAPDQMEELFDMLLGRLSRWDLAEVPQWLLDQEISAGRPWKYLHPESGKPVPPPYAMLAVNPDIEVHWVYRRFHPESHEHHALYKAQGYKMFEMPSTENRFLSETNLRFLMAHDDAFIRRNVMGLWGLPEGAIHNIDNLSVIDGDASLLEYFRNFCLLYRSMDHGDSAPTCCLWWAVDRNDNVFCMREYYQPNQIISRHRQNIHDLSEGERYELDLADPSIFHQMPMRQGGRWSVADEYADVSLLPRSTAIFWQPADNNELSSRNRINEHLRVDPERIHPITKQPGSPRLFFVKRSDQYPQGCFHAIRQLRSARRVKIGTDLGKAVFSDERDPTVPDHALDPTRYFLASRAAAPAPASLSREGTFAGAQRLAKQQRRGMSVRR